MTTRLDDQVTCRHCRAPVPRRWATSYETLRSSWWLCAQCEATQKLILTIKAPVTT